MAGLALTGLAAIAMSSAGCAKWSKSVEKDGGVFGSYEGDYIVISQSGGRIMDVWKMEDVFCDSEGNSDGWSFIDNSGNVVMVGGDAKVIRVNEKNKKDLWAKYNNYHMEFEAQTYREMYNL